MFGGKCEKLEKLFTNDESLILERNVDKRDSFI